jgi:hypothetical protein
VVEALYITELVGLLMIFVGYRLSIASPAAPVPPGSGTGLEVPPVSGGRCSPLSPRNG